METTATPTVREIWEAVRPLDDAFRVVVGRKLNADELEDLEHKWLSVTRPWMHEHIQYQDKVHVELERLIKFCEDRIKTATTDYEKNGITFKRKQHLMEQRIPTAERFLKRYQGLRGQTPFIHWEPYDVVDLRKWGLDKFIRYNFDRFYNH